jgi:hypothetical protein
MPSVSICTTCFNILKLYNVPTGHICAFLMIPMINSNCFPKQHSLADLCYGDVFPVKYNLNFYILI